MASHFDFCWLTHYYKGAITQMRSFLVVCTTFRSSFHVGWKNQNKHSMLNLSFDALAKWREPHNKQCFLIKIKILFEEITIRKNEVDELCVDWAQKLKTTKLVGLSW